MPKSDFNFIFGKWDINSRKLSDLTDPHCTQWIDLRARSEIFEILDGYGHIDRIFVDKSLNVEPFEGFTLRFYNPKTETWKIWWSSTQSPGILDIPVEGQFTGNVGVFLTSYNFAGKEVLVKFEWIKSDPEHPKWQQYFSFDQGKEWKINWIMELRRPIT